jgi:hypothetical protein
MIVLLVVDFDPIKILIIIAAIANKMNSIDNNEHKQQYQAPPHLSIITTK